MKRQAAVTWIRLGLAALVVDALAVQFNASNDRPGTTAKFLSFFTNQSNLLTVRALGQQFDAAGHIVSEWMTANPMTVAPETPVGEALRTMLERGFRHLPVAKDGKVVGIVSIRDLSAATEG